MERSKTKVLSQAGKEDGSTTYSMGQSFGRVYWEKTLQKRLGILVKEVETRVKSHE